MCIALAAYSCRDSCGFGWKQPSAPPSHFNPLSGNRRDHGQVPRQLPESAHSAIWRRCQSENVAVGVSPSFDDLRAIQQPLYFSGWISVEYDLGAAQDSHVPDRRNRPSLLQRSLSVGLTAGMRSTLRCLIVFLAIRLNFLMGFLCPSRQDQCRKATKRREAGRRFRRRPRHRGHR